LDFRWLIKNQDQGLIKVEPAIGTILPNEFQVFTIYIVNIL